MVVDIMPFVHVCESWLRMLLLFGGVEDEAQGWFASRVAARRMPSRKLHI